MSMTGNYDRKNDGPCFWCLRAVKWIPVIFIGAIIVWSYYAYVIQLCFFTVTSIPERVIILILYHLVFLMFSWSYWQTIFTPVGTVPIKFRIPKNELDKLTRETQKLLIESYGKDLPVTNRTVHSSVRYCDRCVVIKPDRAHHCSVCGTCVLKMDHHCPWVNNCVNFTNYKFFVLFLGYSLVYCIYVALTVLKYFIMFWEGKLDNGMGRFHILFLFFVATMFAISLVSLFGYHIYLIFMNRTTLEAFRAPIFRVGGPDKNGYNLGKINNFIEVFGDDKKLWFLPVFTSLGDGIVYPIQQQHILPVYESMGDTTAVSIGDGVSYPTLCMDEDTESLLGNTIMRGGSGGSGVGIIGRGRLNDNDDDDDDDDGDGADNDYDNSHGTRIYIENERSSGTSIH